jgi:hypothetical protein
MDGKEFEVNKLHEYIVIMYLSHCLLSVPAFEEDLFRIRVEQAHHSKVVDYFCPSNIQLLVVHILQNMKQKSQKSRQKQIVWSLNQPFFTSQQDLRPISIA